MSFGFGGAFGSSQPASPFGTSTPAPFGQTPAFGQQNASPFGASSSSLFGASSSAFGGGQSSVFGGGMSSGFGSSGFGAKPAGGGFGSFGGSSPFGSSQAAFGASTPAFGTPQSTPAFGSQPFGASPSNPFGGGGGGGFGTSQPAFGGSPGFGASSSAFGGGNAFGGGFSQQQQQTVGTRNVTYQKVQDQEGAAGSAKSTVYFCTITCMPQYQPPNEKSCNELRWEDYQAGVKGNTGATSSGFGTPQSGGFATPQTSNPFGSFGQPSTPAFGQASSPAFGQSSPGFGFSQPAFGSTGGLFGTPASSSAFGAPSSSPFGSAPFGASSSAFGTPNPFGGGGGFGQSQPAFGASSGMGSTFTSSPAFGTPQSSPAFGGGNLFGQSTPQPFGQQASTGFGLSPAASTGGFNFGGSTPFGSSSPSLFASSGFSFQSSTPAFQSSNLFGTASSFKPAGGGLFGSNPTSTPSLFGQSSAGGLFGSTPSTGGLFGGGGLFGQSSPSLFGGGNAGQQQTGQLQLGGAQAPGIATTPYGTLPNAPNTALTSDIPELRTGLSARPPSYLSQRAVSLLSARPVPSRPIIPPSRLGTPRPRTPRPIESSVDTVKEPERDSSSGLDPPSSGNLFIARKNPLQFFVRDALPSTESSSVHSVSPSAPPSEDADEHRNSTPTSKDGRRASESNGKSQEGQPSPSPRKSPAEQKSPPATTATPTEASPHTNGSARSNRPSISPRQLTDPEITKLLPSTSQENVYLEPSLIQLAAMAREDPDSLKSVSNFKIAHQIYGSVKWMEPIDVTGLDIDSKVRITKSNIEVYLDDRKKPEIGTGLNKPAEIALLGIFKLDKATGKPLKDAASVAQFVKRLKTVSATQNAKFVDYNVEKGVWRFQVDHFSKYGLLDSDSDEEDVKVLPHQNKRYLPAPSSPGSEIAETINTGGLPTAQDDDERMEEASRGGDLEDGEAGLKFTPVAGLGFSMGFPSSSEARVNASPSELAWIKSGLFPPAAKEIKPSEQINGKRRSAEASLVSPPERLRPRLDEARPSSFRTEASLQTRYTNWAEEKHLLEPADSPQGIQVRPQEGEASASECIVRSGDDASLYSQRINVDGGLLLGASFRAGWSLHTQLFGPKFAIPSRKSQAALASELSVRRLIDSRDLSYDEQGSSPELRSHWLALLEEYARHTSASESSIKGSLNRWELKCSPVDELQALCAQFTSINSSHQGKLPKASVQEECVRHQSSVWMLVATLFADIPVPPGTLLDGVDIDDHDKAYGHLLKCKWHARISHWLKAEAAGDLEARLAKETCPYRNIAHLLTGHRIREAAALARSSGHPRLAILIVQGAAVGNARQDIQQQLEIWQRKGLLKHMDQKLVDIYDLLAGNPEPVIDRLKLEWTQAFALYFWYGSKADAELTEPFNAYKEAALHPPQGVHIPEAVPQYVQKFGPITSKEAVDVAFSLIQLATGAIQFHSLADLGQLFLPEARTPEPLNVLESWLLLQVVKAVEALPSTPASIQQEYRLTRDVIAQLQTLGGLEHWEIFVAMHLPQEAGEQDPTVVVKELLTRHAPAFLEDSHKLEFLTDMNLPQPWVSEAFAIWTKYTGDTVGELAHWLDAESWAEAHQTLIESLAAPWFTGGDKDLKDLKDALRRLAPHSAAIDEANGVHAFQHGAGLYLEYNSIKGSLEQNTADEHSVGRVAKFVDLLNSASSVQNIAPLSNRVHATMALRLAEWISNVHTDNLVTLTSCAAMVNKLKCLPPSARAELSQFAALSLSGEI